MTIVEFYQMEEAK